LELVVTIIFGILVAYILYFFLKEKQYSKESVLGNIASTIGVLGTFVGISIGLWKFNPNDITSSVPLLLSGMKIAFATSIIGMAASIFMKYIALKNEDEENIDDIMELFNTMIAESRNVNNTLIENQKQTENVLNKVSEIWASHQENLTVELKSEILNLNKHEISIGIFAPNIKGISKAGPSVSKIHLQNGSALNDTSITALRPLCSGIYITSSDTFPRHFENGISSKISSPSPQSHRESKDSFLCISARLSAYMLNATVNILSL